MIVWSIVIAAVVLLDQVSKHLVMNFLDKEEPFVIIEGIFRFKYVENAGAAFGSFEDNRWIFMIISTVGIIALFIYLWKFRPEGKLACTALSMIIGGGIGNMVDRLFYKGTLPWTEGKNVVIDFIDFYAFPDLWKWVFNVADACVCVGAGILIVWCLASIAGEIKLERAQKAGEKNSAGEDGKDAEQ